MHRRIALPAALALALALTGCGRPSTGPAPADGPAPAAAAPLPDLAALHADVPGIAWHAGDIESAFAAARTTGRPVLLFWGAQWCPLCKQLKASVFARPDFIEKSKLFVPVYLDGDLPAAQKWGDVFRVTGYPTVVVITPDRTEITRLAGGMDLTLYAGLLDTALGDVRPVQDLVDLAADGTGPLATDDCRRLAYHAFTLEDEAVFAAARLADAFERAAARCPADLGRERARLTLLAAGALGRDRATAIIAGAAPDERHRRLIRAADRVLADRDAALANLDVLAGLGATFFTAARRGEPDLVPGLLARWNAVADAAASDPRFTPGDRLAAERLKIAAARAVADDGLVPAPVVAAAVARAEAMLAEKLGAYDRAGVVNAAVNVYLDLNELDRARALLTDAAATSPTPWYYLADLALVEERAGNGARAVELLAEAWAKSTGTASRLQWGYNYVSGLVRLRPDDTAAIEEAALQMLGELKGPDDLHRRSRQRLGKLRQQLADWNTTPERAAVVAGFEAALARQEAGG